MRCNNGHEADRTTGAVLDGKFGQFCDACIKAANRTAGAHHAQWHRDRDFDDHRGDIVQAHLPDGKPNPEFIRIYPDEAKEIFTQEQIEQFGR